MYDKKLSAIFDKDYDNTDKRQNLLEKLSRIKTMRFIRLKSHNIVHYSLNILYKDTLRSINEHAMKLLLEHSLTYSRYSEDLGESDKF